MYVNVERYQMIPLRGEWQSYIFAMPSRQFWGVRSALIHIHIWTVTHFCFLFSGPSSSLKIYEHLTDCYRRNNTEPWAPSSLHILLELIRKVEEAYPTSINMRMMAVSILHGLRIDGIQKAPGVHETEYTIPYGVNKMMASKFKLILDSVSNTPNPINFTEVLTPLELCTFHRLVSSTVEPSLRGDESKTCSPNLSTSADGQGVQCLNQK